MRTSFRFHRSAARRLCFVVLLPAMSMWKPSVECLSATANLTAERPVIINSLTMIACSVWCFHFCR